MADAYDHRCSDPECPYCGQTTRQSCGCHKSREQMMLARIEELETELDEALHPTWEPA